jgi:hypothetical protein
LSKPNFIVLMMLRIVGQGVSVEMLCDQGQTEQKARLNAPLLGNVITDYF